MNGGQQEILRCQYHLIIHSGSGATAKADVEARISAWIAHADHADTFLLRQALFGAGWFEPVPGMR